tara:strand:- start:81 stop:257 length:177 start_codon:yes stop_codon:yes gene_type:complete
LRARRLNAPEIPAPVEYANKSLEKPVSLFDFMTIVVFFAIFTLTEQSVFGLLRHPSRR